jgi:heme exporter protein B
MLRETFALLYKEWLLERRQGYALASLSAYSLSLVFLVSFALKGSAGAGTWLVGYWLVVLFVAVNAAAKSFMGETPGQTLYVYQLARAEAVLLAKLVYNSLLVLVLGALSLVFYLVFMGSPFPSLVVFLPGVALGCMGLGAGLTLVSAIAAQAGNRTTLMALLSLPVVMPQLFLLVRIGQGALNETVRWGDIGFLAGVVGILAALSLVLFPFLWRE